MAKVGTKVKVNVGCKTYKVMLAYSEEFRTKESLNGYIEYIFNIDENMKQLFSHIEDNEMFYIMDFTRLTSFNITKINELLYDINIIRFDDISIPYIYGFKGIKITFKNNIKEYIPCIMGKKGEYWL